MSKFSQYIAASIAGFGIVAAIGLAPAYADNTTSPAESTATETAEPTPTEEPTKTKEKPAPAATVTKTETAPAPTRTPGEGKPAELIPGNAMDRPQTWCSIAPNDPELCPRTAVAPR